MQWSDVVDNPLLENLPFKIELNRYGKIEMTPASNKHGYETPYTQAPEICIDVVSPSNSQEEMLNKARLYLQSGAKEVWIVWENGVTDYYGKTGKLETSTYGVSAI